MAKASAVAVRHANAVQSVDERVAALQDKVDLILERLGVDVVASIELTEGDGSDLDQRIANLEAQNADLKTQIETLKAEMTQGFADLLSGLGKLAAPPKTGK